MKSFSVLMSIYNQEKPEFLEESLKSILINQTIIPNEVVIVKDGIINVGLDSVLKKFQNNFPDIFKIFGYEVNQGLGYALNFGLNKCKNEIIFRMDTDDICVKNRFETQIKIFEKNKNAAIVGGQIKEFINIPDDIDQIRNVPVNPDSIQKIKLKRNPFNHMTVAFKRSIILELDSYKDMPGYEDHYLWIRVLKKYNGYNTSKILVNARIGNDFFERRHGLNFFKKELNFQYRLLSEGFQSVFSFIGNIIIRGFPRLLPKIIFKFIYSKILR